MENTILNKYNYKDSGIEWFGQIPEHWEIRKLWSIGRFTASGIDKLSKENESEVYIINYTDVYKNRQLILDSSIKYMKVTTPDNNRLKHLVQKGDLIFLPSSETFSDLGLSALVNEDLVNVSFSYHVLRFKFLFHVYHGFKKYITNNYSVLGQFSSKGTGSIRKTLNRNDFQNTIVLLPPLHEQKAIADFLDKKTSDIDKLIHLKNQQIDLLKEHRQGIIHTAVTKGLNKQVTFKDSGIDYIGQIPTHWQVKRLKHLGQIVLGKMLCNEDKGNYKYRPYLKSKNIQWLNVNIESVESMWFSDYELDLYRLKKDDLILSEGGEVGKVCIWNNELEECYIQNSAHKVTINKSSNIPKYYLFTLYTIGKKGVFESIVNKVSIGHLTREKLINILLPVPPLAEQAQIVAYLEEQTALIDQAIAQKEAQIAELKAYKQSLINEVVTGKINIL